ncbi:SRPBCC domain-containing protein [Pseudonocardia sp. H11422]|uniref:SRPBCC domain-containing protein n=1 Tax=Pseudonocardia sp. H11422 TaxID=2835866 RepID=UPI001BDC0AFA|nr:SRPBCC domain-containing protein [Pseudonocardia sp. H11422]
MIVDRSISIAASAEETFRRCLDIPFVGGCLPGAQDIREDAPDSYRGVFSIRVGPVSVSLQGTVRVLETDVEGRVAVLRLEGSDRRIGGDVAGDMRIEVAEQSATECRLDVHTDVTISGKLGQFGRAVIVKKADQITEAFVQEFSRQLTAVRTPADVLAGAPATTAPAEPPPAPAARPTLATPPFPASLPAAAPAAVAAGLAVASTPAQSLGALVRRGRRIAMAATGADAARVADTPDLGAVWLTAGAAGAPDTVGVPRVATVRADGDDQLLTALGTAGVPGPHAPDAVAVAPRGAAVGDPEAMAALCRRAATVTGRPVLLVAGAPWSALLCARVASTGAAQGVAVVLDRGVAPEIDAALIVHAVGEIRDAGLELPMLAGPVPLGAVADVLRAGADGVLVDPARVPIATSLRRRLPRLRPASAAGS